MTEHRFAAFAGALTIVLALASTPAAAKPKHTSERHGSDAGEVLADAVFTEVERRIIHDYFGVPTRERSGRRDDRGDDDRGGGNGKSKKMPPGLAKRGTLPPGLAKRDTLPPGLAKRELPGDLRRRLGQPRPGTERVIVDTDVLLVEAATGVVLDIIHDVVAGRN